MPKLKTLSGKEAVAIFEKFGFMVVGGRGSHIKIRRVLRDGYKQTLTFPNHKTLDKGTVKGIFNQATRYVPENELKQFFYTE